MDSLWMPLIAIGMAVCALIGNAYHYRWMKQQRVSGQMSLKREQAANLPASTS